MYGEILFLGIHNSYSYIILTVARMDSTTGVSILKDQIRHKNEVMIAKTVFLCDVPFAVNDFEVWKIRKC